MKRTKLTDRWRMISSKKIAVLAPEQRRSIGADLTKARPRCRADRPVGPKHVQAMRSNGVRIEMRTKRLQLPVRA